MIKLLNTMWKVQAYIFIFLTRVITSKNTNTKILNIFNKDFVKILVVKLISDVNAKDENKFIFLF